jgi:3-oxoacyl-[acyl-carrier protein] reductase
MSDNILDLKGRIGLVTGAGQGVGRQIALHLAGNGAGGVVVNAIHPEKAEAVAKEVEELGCRALPIAADVTDFQAVKGMVGRAADELGPIDILVNNAGNMGAAPERVQPGPFWEASRDSWDAAIGGEPGMEMYSAAKAGAAGFMRAVAKTLGRHLITANCVALAAMRTPTSRGTTEDEERAKQMLRSYTIRRFGEPDDAANMVLFLASDASSWITGQTYPVNGGFSVSL